eukprot:CAMPEP_0174957248 /NCGR_PEP_ID=MMETSP0004_2-20121128/1970_1 /TAXON_ID=420556 /ORGANISM="Ochromonas sp., Strain CCMP1393" /LENGTH=48 /DNA_ID= /DNA_START= /DNA_END= /DNA_ORIENTATION=
MSDTEAQEDDEVVVESGNDLFEKDLVVTRNVPQVDEFYNCRMNMDHSD